MFDSFNGFDFNFNMLPHTTFKLYRYKKRLGKGRQAVTDYDDNVQVVNEPLANSEYNNITYMNQAGGSLRIEANIWWSHIPDVPLHSKLVCDDGREFVTTSGGRTDVVPGSYVYQLKGVDNDA